MTHSQSSLEATFYAHHDGPAALLEAAADVVRAGGIVHGAILCAETPLATLLQELREKSATRQGFGVTGVNPALISWSNPLSDSGLRSRAFVQEDGNDGTVVMLSCDESHDFAVAQSTLLRFLFPRLYRVYLRTRQMRQVLNNTAAADSGTAIRVREYVCKSLIDDPTSLKRARTEREWTDEDHATVFDILTEGQRWLSSIKVELRGSRVASGKIWRDGNFACHSGMGFFWQTVGRHFRAALSESRRFFEKRGRSTNPTGQTRPVSIDYTQGVFGDKRENKRLIRVLGTLADTGLSVVHPNPYLHASLIDYRDGSSYDIWVTTETAILIVPKTIASAASLERLCNHICEDFEEGEVKEFTVA